MKKGRIAAVAAAVILTAGLGTTSVLAEEAVVHEPEVTLVTDKSEYYGNENIMATVKIQNTMTESLTNITLKGEIPTGYMTENGVTAPEQWVTSVNEVKTGEVSELSVTFLKSNSNQNNEKNSGIQENTADSSTTAKVKAAKTGDSQHVVMWILICLLSVAAVIVLVKKKKGRNLLAFFLVILMSGTLLESGMIAKAAESALPIENTVQNTLEVAKDIMVGGKKITLSVQITYDVAEKQTDENILSYEGYNLKWADEFEGNALNLNDWNIETHAPGWVNNELQEYTDSSDNIYVEDGNLVLKPIKTVDSGGNISYTSGRVNTQNKHDFKYGLFEARVKVPKGQGFLPAFWMMPTDENLYGQWPRCGEIDIMEVLGNQTDTSYGTIHYGNPHSESQGKHILDTGSFAEEYHTFSAEWEPGKINWYVDGKRIHTENDWYSVTEGQGEITYPAPFDQPFYIILNLAVGGNWPGNPDATTDIDNASYCIDYVRVYQKDSYEENVTKPEKEVVLREPDANGNYVNNGDFSISEDLTDDENWKFLTALGGVATAEIKNNEINITTAEEGTVDYSVQLVQANLPMKRGATYEVAFDAYADADRTMNVDISAPDRSYRRYMADTKVELTTAKQRFSYRFEMTDKNDANGRLEFNLGKAGSTAGVKISNVSIKKISERNLDENQEKTVLADGNYVYNGGFQEGAGRLGYWEISNNIGAKISVTNENNIRRLKVVAPEGISTQNPVVISQSGLAFADNNTYAVSFLAEGGAGQHIKATVAGQEYVAELTGAEQTYSYKFTTNAGRSNKDIAFEISEPGTFYLDNIRVVEDSLIKNGDFSAGFAGYEPYVDSSISSDVTYVVDSLTEANAADFTIGNTGDAAWKIQLKQNNVELEKEQWYRLSLDAKSDIVRKIMFAIQRDGSSDNDWTPYSGEKIIELGSDYQTYTLEFKMNRETDLKSILSISMGAVDGEQITQKHRVCIDNIKLEKIDAPVVPEQPAGENMLKNGDFSNGSTDWENAVTAPGMANVMFSDNKAVYEVENIGNEDWHIQLKQNGITLEQGCKYRITFHASSTAARTMKLAMLSAAYVWYGGTDIVLQANVETPVTLEFTMNEATDMNTAMVISMGQIKGSDGQNINTPISTITLSDFVLMKVE